MHDVCAVQICVIMVYYCVCMSVCGHVCVYCICLCSLVCGAHRSWWGCCTTFHSCRHPYIKILKVNYFLAKPYSQQTKVAFGICGMDEYSVMHIVCFECQCDNFIVVHCDIKYIGNSDFFFHPPK